VERGPTDGGGQKTVGDAEDDEEGEEDVHAPAADRDGRLWSVGKYREVEIREPEAHPKAIK
jgi:hypothetical protein